MNTLRVHGAAAFGVVAASLLWNHAAHADVVVQSQPAPAPAPVAAPAPQPAVVAAPAPVVVSSPSPVVDRADHDEWRPNRGLFMSGLIAAGVPYVASVVVAATSGHTGDRNLWVPVVGPYIDVGARGGCPASGDCGTEILNKTLLVVDGVFQTVGALEILGSLIFPETVRVTTVARSASGTGVTFTPAKIGDRGAYGLAAVGRF